MLVTLNGKSLEKSLPNMTAAAVMLMIPAHMARQQPLHELAQRRWVSRFDNEMKVVGHQAKSEDLNLMSFLCFSEKR
jgi:hypothetical protein